MPSELDLKYDRMLARRYRGRAAGWSSARTTTGRAIVANFPATLPAFFARFLRAQCRKPRR